MLFPSPIVLSVVMQPVQATRLFMVVIPPLALVFMVVIPPIPIPMLNPPAFMVVILFIPFEFVPA